MKLCSSFALAAVVATTTMTTSVHAYYLDSLNNGKTAHNSLSYVEAPIELGHIQETLPKEEAMVMFENGLDPEMEQAVDVNLAAAAVQVLKDANAAASAAVFEEHPQFSEATIKKEYFSWCAKYSKPAEVARYPTFRENWIRQEEYGVATGQYFWLNEFGDCTQAEYMAIRKLEEHLRDDLQYKHRVEAAAAATAKSASFGAPTEDVTDGSMAAYIAAVAAATQSAEWIAEATVETPVVEEVKKLPVKPIPAPDNGMAAYLEQMANPNAALSSVDTPVIKALDDNFSYMQEAESTEQSSGNYLDNLTGSPSIGTELSEEIADPIEYFLDTLEPMETQDEVNRSGMSSYPDTLSTPEEASMNQEDSEKYEEALGEKHANIENELERAYQVLLDLGMVTATAGAAKKPAAKIEEPGSKVEIKKTISLDKESVEPSMAAVEAAPKPTIFVKKTLAISEPVVDKKSAGTMKENEGARPTFAVKASKPVEAGPIIAKKATEDKKDIKGPGAAFVADKSVEVIALKASKPVEATPVVAKKETKELKEIKPIKEARATFALKTSKPVKAITKKATQDKMDVKGSSAAVAMRANKSVDVGPVVTKKSTAEHKEIKGTRATFAVKNSKPVVTIAKKATQDKIDVNGSSAAFIMRASKSVEVGPVVTKKSTDEPKEMKGSRATFEVKNSKPVETGPVVEKKATPKKAESRATFAVKPIEAVPVVEKAEKKSSEAKKETKQARPTFAVKNSKPVAAKKATVDKDVKVSSDTFTASKSVEVLAVKTSKPIESTPVVAKKARDETKEVKKPRATFAVKTSKPIESTPVVAKASIKTPVVAKKASQDNKEAKAPRATFAVKPVESAPVVTKAETSAETPVVAKKEAKEPRATFAVKTSKPIKSAPVVAKKASNEMKKEVQKPRATLPIVPTSAETSAKTPVVAKKEGEETKEVKKPRATFAVAETPVETPAKTTVDAPAAKKADRIPVASRFSKTDPLCKTDESQPAQQQPKAPDAELKIAKKYSNIDNLRDRAFQILADLGMFKKQ